MASNHACRDNRCAALEAGHAATREALSRALARVDSGKKALAEMQAHYRGEVNDFRAGFESARAGQARSDTRIRELEAQLSERATEPPEAQRHGCLTCGGHVDDAAHDDDGTHSFTSQQPVMRLPATSEPAPVPDVPDGWEWNPSAGPKGEWHKNGWEVWMSFASERHYAFRPGHGGSTGHNSRALAIAHAESHMTADTGGS